jgi:uncharacterized alpha-E superfamily protein
MAFGKSKNPKSVAQITQGLGKILEELRESEVQFEEKRRSNEEKIEHLLAENSDIVIELDRNRNVAENLKKLLGIAND